MIRISAFKWVPPFAQGLVRDLRVRWALEEAGLPYETRLLGFDDTSAPDYRRLQPFGQVPTYEDGEVELFETGAILLRIGEGRETVLPADPAARARATAWMFAALNSVEPFVMNVAAIDLFYAEEQWARLRSPGAVEMVENRLASLEARLDGRDWLEDGFTAGDLLMTTVLRILRHTDLVAKQPALAAYQQRCEARPAFGRALAAQMADFEGNAPPG